MNAQEAKQLIDAIQGMVAGDTRKVVATSPDGKALVKPSSPPMLAPYEPHENGGRHLADGLKPDAWEALYRKFKARLIEEAKDDPILVKLLTTMPAEIIVMFEPRVVTMDGTSLKGRLAKLIATGFFDTPKAQGAARSELKRTGSEPNSGNLSTAVNDFVKDGFLTREGDQYQKAPGVVVRHEEMRTSA